MQFNIISIFPDFIESFSQTGVVGQAIKAGLIKLQTVNPRDFASDAHKSVDDRPFGGGDGMIMLPGPLSDSLEHLEKHQQLGHVVYLSPQGQKWDDEKVRRAADQWVASNQAVTFICGRYGGIDQRIISQYVDDEISLGDFVLSGGELAAMAVVDSVARFIPGVLGNNESPWKESFSSGLLECPQWTRPREFQGLNVPETLVSGDHARIEKERQRVSLLRTWCLRPDLLATMEAGSLNSKLSEALRWAQTIGADELSVWGFNNSQIHKILSGE